MSFIITLYVREGIVMASDSRLSLNATQQQQTSPSVLLLAVGQSDSNYKTFLAPNNIGISTFGAADIGGVPIGGFIESYINEHLSHSTLEVDQVPQDILNYFRNFPNPPSTGFHITGYKSVNNIPEQHVWHVSIDGNLSNRINLSSQQGAIWSGEDDILTRLVQPVFVQNPTGNFIQLPHYKIPWEFFTLQDVIDYAIYAVRTTIDSIRFHPRPKSVGGPIDVLVIKPNRAFWIQRKELHGEISVSPSQLL